MRLQTPRRTGQPANGQVHANFVHFVRSHDRIIEEDKLFEKFDAMVEL